MLLIHVARSFLWHAKRGAHPHALQVWAQATEQRRGHNVAAVAVANKLARIIWAVWRHQRPFAIDQAHSPDRLNSPEDCIEPHVNDGAPVGPARGHADNSAGLRGR